MPYGPLLPKAAVMDACFEEVETALGIDLHPSSLANLAGGVQEQLASLLLTFRPELPGVVLSYSDQRIVTREPMVHAFFPYVHVDATAKLCVLRLQAGQHLGARHPCTAPPRPACPPRYVHFAADCVPMLLRKLYTPRTSASVPHRQSTIECTFTLVLQDCVMAAREGAVGKVAKVGGDYVGLLVLSVFNAAITKAAMRGAFKYDAAVRSRPSLRRCCLHSCPSFPGQATPRACVCSVTLLDEPHQRKSVLRTWHGCRPVDLPALVLLQCARHAMTHQVHD